MTKRMTAAMLMAAALAPMVWGGSVATVRAEDGNTVKAPADVAAKLAIGVAAPEIEATDLQGHAVSLASLQGKPVVLQFGSLTEPAFRMRAADSEAMAAKYGKQVAFVVVYSRESHAADGNDALQANADAGYGIAAPVNEGQRIKMAEQAKERLKLSGQMLLVDAWSNASSLRYGGYANMTFVIDAQGKLQAGFAWMDPAKVRGALNAILAGKEVPEADRGQTRPGVPGTLDFANAAKSLDGYRGGALALAIDGIKMTDAQQAAIYPALAEYLYEGKNFREHFGNGKGGTPKKPVAAPAPGGDKGKTDGDKMMDGDKAMAGNDSGGGAAKPAEVNAEDFATALNKLRVSAQKLKAACVDNLSDKDAKAILDVLEQGPARRLFGD